MVIQKYWRRALAKRKLLMLKKEKLERVHSKSASIIQVWYSEFLDLKRFNDTFKRVQYDKVLNSILGFYILSSTLTNIWYLPTTCKTLGYVEHEDQTNRSPSFALTGGAV